MANFPDIRDIGGRHLDVYEAYYRGLDPKSTNQIGALDAAKFLKKSGLSDVVLSRVWDLSDPMARGYLDKTGLFVALKLISLAQAGEKIDVKNLRLETNAPRCGDVPKMKPPPVPKMTHPGVPPHPSVVAASANADWTMKPEEKTKYQALFTQLQPENGVLPGNKVKGVLMNSKLPLDTLSSIWELADQDKDGSLDEHEFLVAMHLVYKALENRAIPSALPKELQKQALKAPPADDFGGGFVANFPTDIVPVAPTIPPPARPPIPVAPAAIIPSIPAPISYGPGEWVLTTIEKLKYQEVFEKSDLDKDGLVSGLEIKDIFLKSGLPQNMLAHIWALCDTNQTGKLNNEQFALAMWLIDRKKKGIDPPQVLAPEMIPPCMRPNAAPPQPPKPIYTNPELEMISKEIEELTKERHAIEAEVAQKEADIRIKNGEMRSLQSELDTLTATLKQLENQKEAAQKRLDDLKAQVDKLKEQCQKQEDTIKEQETELDSRKEELQKLKDEEKALELEYDKNLKEKDKISVQLQDTQLQISQIRAMFTQLEEIQRQMKDALELCKVAIEENNAAIVSDYSLGIEPEFRDFKKVLLSPEEKPKDAFNDNSFGDAFKPATTTSAGFDDSFDNKASGFGDDDKWGNDDKWNDPFGATAAANDPFAGSNTETTTKIASKDAFESDPFAALHAPPKGSTVSPIHAPESPSPALPPKTEKTKKPPPRPAPPKPKAPDAFASSSFANFDDFDLKASTTSLHAVESVKVDTKNTSKSTQELSTDFQEDPFKNYRYEDPFMIEDPFKDENGNQKEKVTDIFEKDTFGQDAFGTSAAATFEPFGKPQSKSASPFEPFGAPERKNTPTFDAFGKSEINAFDAFGNTDTNSNAFDAFDNSTSKTNAFDAFEPFGNSDFSNNNVKNGTGDAFDPFGLAVTDSKKNKTSTTPGFGFEGDFANFDAFNNNNATTEAFNVSSNGNDAWGSTTKVKKSNDDGFASWGKKENVMGKIKKSKEPEVKKIDKFSADYSDNYERDLNEILKRSMIDQ